MLPTLCLTLAPLLATPVRAEDQQTREIDLPNVVIFMIDDVADSDIDVTRTPTIDYLASTGVRFRRAYSHAYCQPTRDALFHSQWIGRKHGGDCDPPSSETRDHGDFNLTSIFEAAGYATAHFGKWHLGANAIGPWEMTPHLRGYDAVRAGMPIGCTSPANQWLRLDDGTAVLDSTQRTIALRDAFSDWWTTTRGPKFAFVNFLAAHAPFIVPPKSILYPWYKAPKFARNREKYESEIIGADFVMGQLLPLLGDNTLILFLGDNGTPGYTNSAPHSETDATRPDQDPERVKLSCFEDGVRVPFILSHSRLPQGVETDALVHVIDILPTFADLIGLRVRAPIDGESFANVLLGEGPGREWLYVDSWGRPDEAIITPRWKLITLFDRTEELYDLRLDPKEKRPLAPVGPVAEQLRRLRESVTNPSPTAFRPTRHFGTLRTRSVVSRPAR